MHFSFFIYRDPPPSKIYPLSLHDALPIFRLGCGAVNARQTFAGNGTSPLNHFAGNHKFLEDRKSTRLNSSHLVISYAVFCLKKKNKNVLRDRTERWYEILYKVPNYVSTRM